MNQGKNYFGNAAIEEAVEPVGAKDGKPVYPPVGDLPHRNWENEGFEAGNDNNAGGADPQENQIAALNEMNEKLQGVIVEQQTTLNELCDMPLELCTVNSSNHKILPERFEKGDRVQLIDEEHEAFQIVGGMPPQGMIVSEGVSEDGKIDVEFPGFLALAQNQYTLNIGLGEDKPQVRLMIKNDGSNVVVVKGDGTKIECRNPHRFDPKPGDLAKVNMKTFQIMEVAENEGLGQLCKVATKPVDGQCEVEGCGGQHTTTLIKCTLEGVELGDRVVVSGGVAIKLISDKENQKFKIKEELKVNWEDVGGLEQAKEELREAIELPATHPEIFKFYKKRVPAGILLYGPPGCGKTMLGKAAATSLAKVHNKESFTTGFNYVKGPEMLDMWVGNSEKMVRELFARGRRHFEEQGYPCLTFVDEADAILQERGGEAGKVSQRWQDSLVAQWLAEMDGLEASNHIVILATNRPKSLDGAIVREGRVDRHIKVPRPDQNNAGIIFNIHLKDIPLHGGVTTEQMAALAIEDLWGNNRPLYMVDHGDDKAIFSLIHCLSGAMIAGIVQEAVSKALRRDLKNGQQIGVTVDDMKDAINSAYARHRDLNHHFDVLDFYDVNGYDEKQAKLTKVAAA